MITVTDKAKEKFLEIVKAENRQGQGLRVIVKNGGSSQSEFALNFVAEADAREDDIIVDVEAIKVYVDPESAKYLEKASIDFIDTLTERAARGNRLSANREPGTQGEARQEADPTQSAAPARSER